MDLIIGTGPFPQSTFTFDERKAKTDQGPGGDVFIEAPV